MDRPHGQQMCRQEVEIHVQAMDKGEAKDQQMPRQELEINGLPMAPVQGLQPTHQGEIIQADSDHLPDREQFRPQNQHPQGKQTRGPDLRMALVPRAKTESLQATHERKSADLVTDPDQKVVPVVRVLELVQRQPHKAHPNQILIQP